MNPLNAIVRPAEAFANLFEKPSLALGFGLVLVSTLFAAAAVFAVGFGFNPLAFGVQFVYDAAQWILLAALIYVIAYVIKGGNIKGKFWSIATALALFKIVAIALVALQVLVLMVAMPNYPSAMQELSLESITGALTAGTISEAEYAASVDLFLVEATSDVNLSLLGTLVALMGILLVYSFYALYVFNKHWYEYSEIPTFIKRTSIPVAILTLALYIPTFLLVLL